MFQLTANRFGKVTYFKMLANKELDAGKRIRYVSMDVDVVIERIDGVDYIVAEDGSKTVDSVGYFKSVSPQPTN
jgi:hypothetical protein